MAGQFSEAARGALAGTDWAWVDAMSEADMGPVIDVREIRRAAGMTQLAFAAAFEFSLRTLQEWERGAKRPSWPARTLLRAIKADPEGVRRELAAA